MSSERRMTEAEALEQERLELGGRPLKIERNRDLKTLYDFFRRKHFPGMPACPVGFDYRPHYFILGSWGRDEGIVIRNNPAVISNQENCAHIVLHEMTHQWQFWVAGQDEEAAGLYLARHERDPGGHDMAFWRKMRAVMAAQFPGRGDMGAGLAKLRY